MQEEPPNRSYNQTTRYCRTTMMWERGLGNNTRTCLFSYPLISCFCLLLVKSNQEPKDRGAPGHIPRGQPPRTQRRTKNRLSGGMWAHGRKLTRCLSVDHPLLLRISSRTSAHHERIGLIRPLPLCSPCSHHFYSLPHTVPFCVLWSSPWSLNCCFQCLEHPSLFPSQLILSLQVQVKHHLLS